jgi:hypothetical protein
MALVTLTGGHFQDSEGAVLTSGYLTMELSHDEQDPVSGAQIAAGLTIRIQLDNNGNVATGQQVWSTAPLLPSGAFYIVEAFTEDGRHAWASSQNETVPDTGTFDVGTWIPNQPVAQPTSVIVLQTNGVNNSNQNLENLAAGTNITLSNSNGATTITAASGGTTFSTAGSGWFWGGKSLAPFPTTSGVNFAPTGVANEVTAIELLLESSFTIRKLTIFVESGSAVVQFMCAIYDSTGTTKLLDAGTNAFSTASSSASVSVTLSSPVTLAGGQFWFACGSDSASSTQSPGHQTLNTSQFLFNNNVARYGKSSNTISSGVMPSSLGTITKFGAIAINIPAVLFEV